MKQKNDLNSVINRLRVRPVEKSRIGIPLCRLRALPLVRPINLLDVQRLENEFVTGYQDGDRVLYVALHNHKDEDLKVTEAISSTWDPFWKAASDDFDARVSAKGRGVYEHVNFVLVYLHRCSQESLFYSHF